MTNSRDRVPALMACAAAALLVLARSWVYLRYEFLDFDADQAVIGLMAKHFGDGRAFALYQYAFDYVLVVNAWVAAPLVRYLGASVAVIRTPELAFNVAVACLLLLALIKDVRLPARLAFVAALPVILPTPLLTGNLMSTLGGNVEPLLYVLLIWWLRERPVACGIVAAIGLLTREFTAYGIAALVAVDLLEGRLFTAARARFYAVSVLTAAVLLEAVSVARPHVDRFGPGSAALAVTLSDPSSAARLAGNFCFAPAQAARNLLDVFGPYLAKYLGLAQLPDSLPGLHAGVAWAWPLLVAFVAVIAARVLRAGWASGRRVLDWPAFPVYLVLVGLQSFAMYAVSRCGDLSTMTVRYALLGVFAFVGAAALCFSVERTRGWRNVVVALCVAMTAVAAYEHVRLIQHLSSSKEPGEHRVLTTYLLAHGVRYARAPYWAAYQVAFLSGEKIVATPSDWVARVLEYDRLVSAHVDEAAEVSTEPCAGGEQVARWHVCLPRN